MRKLKGGADGQDHPPRTREVGNLRETLRRLLNIVFCLAGLALGFLYLGRHLFIGWLFIGAFTFFLFLQIPEGRDSDG